jgi:hypothetical protein
LQAFWFHVQYVHYYKALCYWNQAWSFLINWQ